MEMDAMGDKNILKNIYKRAAIVLLS